MSKKTVSRRDFVKATALGSGAMILAACAAPAATAAPEAAATAAPAATAMPEPTAIPATAVPEATAVPVVSSADFRKQLLQIPGVGKGSPTDAEWQKVGEMLLDSTKQNVKEGEFAGVELSFLGLNNQNLHNMLFRGFLKPWEAYTGAKISWIDLARQTTTHDYSNPSPPALSTSTSPRWVHRLKAMCAARVWPLKCPTGSGHRSIWTTMSVT